MPIEVRPLLFKPHRLNGLSDRLLISHYENNYGGALRRLNAIQARLRTRLARRAGVRDQRHEARGADCRRFGHPA